MITIFEQVLTLFLFAAAGFVLAKTGLINKEHSKTLSVILVYVVNPCAIFKTFASQFNVPYLQEKAAILIVSTVTVFAIALIAHQAAKLFSKDKYERGVYAYALTIPNIGYMGYPMAERLMGSVGMLNAMVFALPMNALYIYTIGFCNLTKKKFSFRNLLNPVFIPVVIGAAAGLVNLPLPDVAWSIFDAGSNMMGPLSMLMTGIVVSEFDLKKLLTDKKTYLVVLVRLIIAPILVGICLQWLPDKDIMKIAVLLYAMPCGLNTIIFPKLVDENCEYGASQAFISNVAACATIPVVLSLFGM